VSVEIARRSAADDDALFAIQARIFGDRVADTRRAIWRWQYQDNPHSPDGPVVWIARCGGRPIGQMGTMPVRLQWGDREVRASWGVDYFVDPATEGQGHAITLARAWIDHVDVALAVGLTPTSYLICKRLGFHDLGRVPLFQAVLDPAAVARRRWGRVAGALAAPIGVAARLGRKRRPDDVDVVPADEIGADYDALWDGARRGYAMCVRRDAAYVRWKYRSAPHKAYEILEARRSGRLTGFAVSRHEVLRGLRLGWVADLFAGPDDAPTRDALIAEALDRLARAGVARVQMYCTFAPLVDSLRRYGFFTGASHARLCARPRGVSDRPTTSPAAWHVVFGDSDSDR
jgi:hypothetical protein